LCYTCLNWLFIPEPFNLEGWIVDRNQAALEVSSLSLGNWVDVLQWCSEHGTLSGRGVLDLWTLVGAVAFQLLDFLKTLGPGRLVNDATLACAQKKNG
jgi:hypothetical protein